MMRRALTLAAMLAGSFAAGCSDDYSVELAMESQPPVGVDVNITDDEVRLQDGIAVAILARPMEDDEKMDWDTELELETTNVGVIQISRLEFDQSREERKDVDLRDGDWRFLLEGQREGRASIEVWADGELISEVQVLVTEQ